MKGALPCLAMLLIGSAPASPNLIGALGWMSGSWEARNGARWTEEHWTQPRGGMMMGVSRSGDAGGLAEFEFLRIALDEGGTLTYWAAPQGRSAVGFRLVEAGSSSVAFENRRHDYPQRVAYRRAGNEMTATISAADGSKARSWTYRRQH